MTRLLSWNLLMLAIVALAACGQGQTQVDASQNVAEDGHHAAQGVVDDEVWAMIDEMVADTPHGDMTLEDLGSGMMEATIETQSVDELERIIEDSDLLRTIAMLDGDVTVTITFAADGTTTMTILQQL